MLLIYDIVVIHLLLIFNIKLILEAFI